LLRFSGSANVAINDLAVSADNDVVVIGTFSGSADFGTGLRTGAGTDVFVARYAANGAAVWVGTFGGPFNDRGLGVDVDDDGNMVITGNFVSSISFGGAALTAAGASDAFVAFFDAAGMLLWNKTFGGAGDDSGVAAAFAPSGDVALTGTFAFSVDFGGGALSSKGKHDVFVAGYSAVDGSHLWSKRFGSSEVDRPADIAVDSTGRVALTGLFYNSINMGGGPRSSAGDSDIFVGVYAMSNGAHVWSKRFGSTTYDEGFGVAFDTEDNLLLTGLFSKSIDFGGGKLENLGDLDIYLAKLSPTFQEVWAQAFGGANAVGGFSTRAVASDQDDAVLFIGTAIDTIDLGTGQLSGTGGTDPIIAKFRGDGVPLWSKRFVGSLIASVSGIRADSDSRVIATGTLSGGNIDFGGGPIAVSGGTDGFILTLDR
jgi:hypothetical protein